MNLQAKLWLSVGLVTLLGFIVFEWQSFQSINRRILAEAQADARTLRTVLLAARGLYDHAAAAPEAPPGEAPLTGATLAFLPLHTLDSVAQELVAAGESELSFSTVALRTNNPMHLADAAEVRVIRYFEDHPEATEHFERVTPEGGQAYYLFAQPLRVESHCLTCHGERSQAPPLIQAYSPGAFGYELGELRGILSIRLPLAQIREQAFALWGTAAKNHALVFLSILLFGGILIQRLVIDRIRRLREGIAAFSDGDLGVRIPRRGHDEITELGETFNQMAGEIEGRVNEISRQNLALAEFRSLMDQAQDAFFIVDLESGRILDTNCRAQRYLGYDREALRQLTVVDIDAHLSDLAAWRAEWASGPAERLFEATHRRRDGSTIEVEISAQAFEQDGRTRLLASVRDISERRASEETLRLAAKVFACAGEGLMITDAAQRVIEVNEAFTRLSGYERAELVGQRPPILTRTGPDDGVYRALWEGLAACDRWEGEIWNRRKSGERYPAWLTISALRDDAGQVTHYVGVFRDISQVKASEQQLERLAHYDGLTGLPNRALLVTRLRHALERASRYGNQVALLFLDLDRFKNINDSLGHPSGDALLKAVATRLGTRVRGHDTFARLGGDEFVVLLEDLTQAEQAALVAQSLLAQQTQPYQLEGGYEVTATLSIGISLYPGDGSDPTTLIRNADAAMYAAKTAGRNTWRYYTEELGRQASERLETEIALRRAVQSRDIFIELQPIVDLDNGGLVGAECLARWSLDDGTRVPPQRFIPVAEETGLIRPIGQQVLRQACELLAAWRDGPLGGLWLSVNLSGRQLDSDFPDELAQLIRELEVEPHRLELEITESVLVHRADAGDQVLQALRRLGVRLSIDDFGTGYSSLAYLKQFSIDKLKIDRSFIHDLSRDAGDRQIVSTIAGMAHNLSLEVVAEGVETPEQAAYLRGIGCELGQGYLFSAPLGAATFSHWALAPDNPHRCCSARSQPSQRDRAVPG